MERRIKMSIKPAIVPAEGTEYTVPIQTLPSAETAPLPAPLPAGLPANGVFDSLFSGLPGGAFIGRYWWILLLIFINIGFLLPLALLFLLYPQIFSRLGLRR
jgi:hypothetical protein